MYGKKITKLDYLRNENLIIPIKQSLIFFNFLLNIRFDYYRKENLD